MNKKDFFQGSNEITHTPEYLQCYMTSELPVVQDDYILSGVFVGVDNRTLADSKIKVFMPLIDRERPENMDYLVYSPADGSMVLSLGCVPVFPLNNSDLGRQFKLSLNDGMVTGRVVLVNGLYSLQYKS